MTERFYLTFLCSSAVLNLKIVHLICFFGLLVFIKYTYELKICTVDGNFEIMHPMRSSQQVILFLEFDK